MQRIVVAGFGSMGSLYSDILHSGDIRNGRLYGICTRGNSKTSAIKGRYPDAKVYESEAEMFDDSRSFDALLITSPHKKHFEIASKALSNGLDVLCEKPLCATVSEGCQLLSSASLSSGRIAVMFNWRFRSIFKRVKDIISSGRLGHITHAVWIANLWYRTSYYHHLSPWRSTWEGEGGGLALNQMQHIYSIWEWLFGTPDSVLSSVSYGKFSSISVDDSFEAILKHASGLDGVIVASTGESPGSNHLEIHGSMGKLVVEGEDIILDINNIDSALFMKEASVTTGIPYAETKEREEDNSGKGEYIDALNEFCDAVESGKAFVSPADDGVDCLRLSAAIYLSSYLGRAVSLEDLSLYDSFIAEKIKEESGL